MTETLAPITPADQPARAVQDDSPARQRTSMAAAVLREIRADALDRSALTEILEELDTGVIVCDETGHVLLANDAARRELQRGMPLRLDNLGQLHVAAQSMDKALAWRKALRQAIHLRHRQLLPVGEGADKLMVSFVPLGSPQQRVGLLLLGRRHAAPELTVEMLGSIYRLTRAEKAVLLALFAGMHPDEVARARNVKMCTLRTQIASLRAKMGGPRLDELARQVYVLPPMNGALRSPALRDCATVFTHVPAADPGLVPASRAA